MLAWSAIVAAAIGSEVPRAPLVAGSIVAGLIFVASAMCIRYAQPRWMLFWIIFIGTAARLFLIAVPPVRQSDYVRYLWDGLVVTHGFDPWAQSPAAALSGKSAGLPAGLHALALRHPNLIKCINHNKLPTIYPPVSEAVFAAAAYMAPASAVALKWWLLLFDAGTAAVIWLTLRRLCLPSCWLLLYWWNPVVINSFANEAHLDSIVVFFTALFYFLFISGYLFRAAITLSLAIGAKFWPLVLTAVIIRRYWQAPRRLAAALAILTLSTLIVLSPMLATGPRAFISVEAYASYWQVNDLIFRLISHFWSLLITSWFAAQFGSRVTVIAIYSIAVILVLWRRPRGERDLITRGLLLVALIFLLSPTEFPWYYTWMVPMLAVSPRLSILLWSSTLGLYHMVYIDPALIWVEHLPVILLFLLEAAIPAFRWFPCASAANDAPRIDISGALK